MKIENQIKENRRKFRVDHFDIILSEYISKIMQNNLILNPPYQRTFRWTIEDQSTLIESILLGIPIPPIFVFQREDSKWEVIDGLQRTMTIYNFLLSDNPITLTGLKILTELNELKANELSEEIRLKILNFRIRIELVEETQDIFSQYLLFNRLNSNGEKLSDQEKRNFLIYKKNPTFYEKIQKLGNKEYFLNVLGWKHGDNLDERIRKQEHIEYLTKYFLARFISKVDKKTSYSTIDDFINNEIINFLNIISTADLESEYIIFKKTFNFLNANFGIDTLKKKGKKANNISNRFTITTGISFLIENNIDDPKKISELIEDYFNSKEYLRLTKSGYSPTKRIYELNRYSFLFFKGDL